MMIIYMGHFTIPAYEYHFYTISTFSRIPPPPSIQKTQNKTNQVHVLVIIDYVHLSNMYSSFSPYDSDQSSLHQKSLEQYKYILFII